MNLDKLREHLSAVDRELLQLVARRQRIVAEIGSTKIKAGAATRDYEREREIFDLAHAQAIKLGLEPDVAKKIMKVLIQTSLTSQEQAKVTASNAGVGKRSLIIGGAGKMGSWFADFLSSQAFEVEVADPSSEQSSYPQIDNWQDSSLDHEIIVIATPIKTTAEILTGLSKRRPAGLIFDIGSLKTPLKSSLSNLANSGCLVTSIHPMFGPETRLLAGRHIIFIDVGVPAATAGARAMFASTMADQVTMTLEEHDKLIAYVLGLSHALNLIFFTALSESGELAPHLKQLSSTTFNAQMEVASLVAKDNPRLYFEIQALNAYGLTSLDALTQASERIKGLIENKDEAGFVDLMESGRSYLSSRN